MDDYHMDCHIGTYFKRGERPDRAKALVIRLGCRVQFPKTVSSRIILPNIQLGHL